MQTIWRSYPPLQFLLKRLSTSRLISCRAGIPPTFHGCSAEQTLDGSTNSAWENRSCSVASLFIASRLTGCHTDAITLSAEVIESKVKPSKAWGEVGQTAFGERPPGPDRGHISQTILAIGQQDTRSVRPSTHLTGSMCSGPVATISSWSPTTVLRLAAEMTFQLNYSALVRAMTSPFVAEVVKPPCGTLSKIIEANNG